MLKLRGERLWELYMSHSVGKMKKSLKSQNTQKRRVCLNLIKHQCFREIFCLLLSHLFSEMKHRFCSHTRGNLDLVQLDWFILPWQKVLVKVLGENPDSARVFYVVHISFLLIHFFFLEASLHTISFVLTIRAKYNHAIYP